MLQSTVNLLSNSSIVWNSQYLKKILRIPEDQQKILNNIPGWDSQVDSKQPSPSLLTVDKDNQQTSIVAQNLESTASQKDLIIAVGKGNQQISLVAPIPENFVSRKDFTGDLEKVDNSTENINKKERFPLRKSSSLDSVSSGKTKSFHPILKRSSSSSNIKEKAITFQKISFDTPNFSLKKMSISEKISPLSNIQEVKEMQVDMDRHCIEKSQFSHSGVQCKMSQDLNLELDASQTITLPYHTDSNFSVKKQTVKHLNVLVVTNSQREGEKLVEKLNLCESKNNSVVLFKESLNGKSKSDAMNMDESYISLPIPCTQPHENICPEKELVSNTGECSTASQKNNFRTIPKNMLSSLDKSNLNLSTKRKRKSKQEKSKKHRGIETDIKIEYSSEQVKNMITLMKVLQKY